MSAAEMPSPPAERTLTLAKSEYAAGAERLIAMVWRDLQIFDPDLSEFRLEQPSRIEALRQFLARSPSNRLQIALHDPEYVKRHCPRLMSLLGVYSASMRIHRTQGEAGRLQDCFMLADRQHVVRRPVSAQGRGVIIISNPQEGLAMHERFSDIWEMSELGISATTSGL